MDDKNGKQDEKKIDDKEFTPDKVDEAFEEIDQEDKEKEELKKRITECEEKYRRALADYQNLQRRTQEQKAEWIKSANKDLLLKLLPVLDTLMLAAKHIDDKGLHIGVDQFVKVLEETGAERIETVEKDFDPLVMECIETREGKQWKVLEEVQSGYRIGDVILRPARVVVGKQI